MLNSNKNRDDLEKLNELVSLQNQVKAVRIQDNLGKQSFHYDAKRLYEPLTDTIKDTSRGLTKTITEPSIKNNIAFDNLNERI